MPTETEIAWLAGLLEGEGCFDLRVPREPTWRVRIRVSLRMCDQDIVSRAAALFLSRETMHQDKSPSTLSASSTPLFVQSWNGKQAEYVMRSVYPYMGNRRQSKIAQCVLTPNLSHRPAGAQIAPLHSSPMSKNIAWVAGLLEGEGYFGAVPRPGRTQLCVEVKMSDHDVLMCASTLFPSATTIRKCAIDARWRASKQLYKKGWNGADAELVMRAVLPFMGRRRATKIQECLATPNLSHHPRHD